MSDSPASPRRRHRLRWPLGIAVALVAGVALAEWAGWPFLKGPLESQLGQRLQREVRFGEDFSLRLFGSLRLATSALRIGPPQGAQADPALDGHLVDASDAYVQVPYSTVFALVRGDHETPPRIAAIRVGRIDASLKRLPDGRANWTFAPKDPEAKKTATPLPEVDELVVRNGHLALRDAVTRTTLDAEVQTREGDRAGGNGAGLSVQGKGRWQDRPLAFRFTSSGALPLIARGNPDPVPVTMHIEARDARFGFEGTATDLLSFRALDGNATLSGPSLAAVGEALGLTLPTTSPFGLKGRLSKAGETWSLQRADLEVGRSRLGGDFRYDRSARPPTLAGELRGTQLVLADLLPAFGAANKPPAQAARENPKASADGRVLPRREFDIPSLRAMNAEVKVNLQRADLGSLFRQPLQPLQGDLSLKDGVLKLANLVARTAGGELKGGLGLDARSAQPAWSADLRWAGVELDQWLKPRNRVTREVKASGEKPAYVTGKLGGHAQLQARGKSTAAMLGSLDGTVQAWVRDGTISHVLVEAAGIDVAQALGVMITGDNRLPMHCAAVRAVAKDGVIKPDVALIDTRDSTLLVDGTVSLADERLALTMTSRPKDVSPASLRAPVHVNGTFGKPEVNLEKKPIALRLLGAAALAVVNPLAALIPLIDTGDKELAGGCQRTLQALRDADGPAGAPASKAPRRPQSSDDDKSSRATPAAASPQRQAAGSAPLRK